MTSLGSPRRELAMRLSVSAIAAATLAALAACGSAAPDARATVHCDRYAQPGVGTVERLAESLEPGETGCLHGGRYLGSGYDGYVLRPSRGGRRGRPITIRSAPGERARLRGIVYFPAGAGHYRLTHVALDAQHPQRPADSQIGIQVLADRVELSDSEITTHGNQTCLIATSGARRTLIRGNTFHDCGGVGDPMTDHAIYLADTRRARVVDNVLLRTSGFAVHLYPRAERSFIARNLMWENGGAVIFAGDGPYASDRNVVVDNVMGASRARPELSSSWGGPEGRGNVARANCIAPGQAPSLGGGFRVFDNEITDGPGCFADAPASLTSALGAVAPALVARLLP